MALTGISFGKDNHLVSKKDPAYSERALTDIDYAREMKATIFRWKAIPNLVMTRIKDMQSQSSMTVGDMTTQTFNMRMQQRNREIFRYAVFDIENYPDEDGNPIKAETTFTLEPGGVSVNVLSEETMNSIHSSVIAEIGNEIFMRCDMGEDERKKFAAALSQLEGSGTSNAESATSDSAASEDATDQPSSTPTTQKAKKTATGGTRPRAKKKAAAPAD